MQDAGRVTAALELVSQNEYRRTDDVQLYTINVHGIKSALANIGEKELSDFAYKLEKAGRDNNVEVLKNETPVFLEALNALVERIKPKETDDDSVSGGDIMDMNADDVRSFLLEKLLIIKKACIDFDKKTAKGTIAELREKTWPKQTREMLSAIAEYLLHSEFEEVITIVDEYAKNSGA